MSSPDGCGTEVQWEKDQQKKQLDREEGAARTVQRFYRRHLAWKHFLSLREKRTEEEPQRSQSFAFRTALDKIQSLQTYVDQMQTYVTQMQKKTIDERSKLSSLSEAEVDRELEKVIDQYKALKALKAYRAEHFPSSTDDADERVESAAASPFLCRTQTRRTLTASDQLDS